MKASRVAWFALAAATMVAALPATAQEAREIRIAQQFGISYLPFHVMREQRLLEKFVAESGLPEPTVEWATFSGAAAMNDALISNNLDFASAGVGPLITIWARTRGNLKVHGVASLGSMPNYLTTNNPAVKSLKDFTEKDRIALPAVKVGFQAVVLQMAAEQAFGPGQHGKLDPLTVSMSHPDATTALLGGRSEVTAHFASPPFQNRQLQDPRIHRVLSSYDVLGGPHIFNVVYATSRYREANPRTFKAFVSALDAAMAYINRDPKGAAQIYLRSERSNLAPDFVESLVTDKEHKFTVTPENSIKFAEFLYRTGQVKEQAKSWKDLFFPDIHDRPGS